MSWKERLGLVFAYGWFVRSSYAGLGPVVQVATPNFSERAQTALLRYGPAVAMLPILVAVIRLESHWLFAVVLAFVVLSTVVQSWLPPADVQFFEKGMAGSFKPRDPFLLAMPVRQIVRYDVIQNAELDRNGNLVVTVRDPKTLRSRSWVAAIPPSRRRDVSALLPVIARHPSGTRSGEFAVRSPEGIEPEPRKPGKGW